jgi:hypothetical protein
MPVSNTLLLVPPAALLTVDPETSKQSCLHSLLARVNFGFRVGSTVGAIHSPLVHGIETFVSATPVRRKLPITPNARAHEAMPGHRLVLRWCWSFGEACSSRFFCFLRENNFIVRKADAFNTRWHLCRGDMNFGRSDVTHSTIPRPTNSTSAYTGLCRSLVTFWIPCAPWLMPSGSAAC